MVLTVFAAVGLARWIATRAYFAVAATARRGHRRLARRVELVRSDVAGRREADAKLFAQTPDMWAAVRRHAGADERIANNPLFLADMTLWPVDISWALLADRRSCLPGRELTLVYTSLPRQRQEEIDAQFIRVFAGKGSSGRHRRPRNEIRLPLGGADIGRRRVGERPVRREPALSSDRREGRRVADLSRAKANGPVARMEAKRTCG